MTEWKSNIKSSYAHKNFGFIGPDVISRSDVNNLEQKLSNTNSTINTEIILLRKPVVNALITDYQFHINRTTSAFGVAIFSEDNWRGILYISVTPPAELDADPVAVFQKAMLSTSTNIPTRVIYGDEVINRKIDVSVKLKKIDFSNLPNSILNEFTTYLKNGNKLEYGEDDNFISRLNENVIVEKVLPPVEAEMIIDDNILENITYEKELGQIEADAITQVLGQLSNGLLGLVSQVSDEIGTAMEVAKFIGDAITGIADSTDMEIFNSNTVPSGKIAKKVITMDENNIYFRNLDYVHLYSEPHSLPTFVRASDNEINADAVNVTHPARIYSEFAGDYTLSKLRTTINKKLLKDVKFSTSYFFEEIYKKQFPDKLGKAGIIMAGSPLDFLPPNESLYSANYKTYTHPTTDTSTVPLQDRLYMQYKFNLNLDLASYEFPEPDEEGGFTNGPIYNSVWIDDMPFGFYHSGRWYYTRYATDLPYSAPPVI